MPKMQKSLPKAKEQKSRCQKVAKTTFVDIQIEHILCLKDSQKQMILPDFHFLDHPSQAAYPMAIAHSFGTEFLLPLLAVPG